MSTTTPNLGLIKPALDDAADITQMNQNWDKIDEEIVKFVTLQTIHDVFTAVGTHNQYTGSKYAVTVPGLTQLYPGLKLTIIPDSSSVIKYCKLNVNDLGDAYLVQPMSHSTATASYGSSNDWIKKDYPIEVMYDGSMWRVLNITAPSLEYLSGVVPIKNGGTGADTPAQALIALGGVSKTLVWENASIETENGEFAMQTINIADIDTYDGFEIAYVDIGGDQFHLYSTGFIPYYNNQMINLSAPLLDKIAVRGGRMSGIGIFMFPAEYREYVANAQEIEDNHYCIPYKVYGIKGVKSLA